ncbi:2-C-methyl-D-erythritol 4-phosphate cytidylyltransferase [Actinotalea sp. AC32]|nr:2-C-methyl-D-erythritol 4-phosphate cytidylyltransferase [Actinotalea sp. AC32]
MRVAVVLTAAGNGSRLGHALPKALVPAGGVPLVRHALDRLLSSGVVDEVVVTVPGEHRSAVEDALAGAGGGAHRSAVPPADGAGDDPAVAVRCVVGGATRQASVAAGLAALSPDVDVVLVHDAARALTPGAVTARVVEAVLAGARAVVPVVPVTDSVVRVDDGVTPVDRATLRAVQTPQGFERRVLDEAHAAARGRAGDESSAATDDASLCVALGVPVTAVDGHPDAFKVTTGQDLALAELLLAGSRPARGGRHRLRGDA